MLETYSLNVEYNQNFVGCQSSCSDCQNSLWPGHDHVSPSGPLLMTCLLPHILNSLSLCLLHGSTWVTPCHWSLCSLNISHSLYTSSLCPLDRAWSFISIVCPVPWKWQYCEGGQFVSPFISLTSGIILGTYYTFGINIHWTNDSFLFFT